LAFEDLLSLRVLERQPTVALPMDIIKSQTTSTEWGIRPTVESPTTAHEEAADEIETFLDGGFNANEEEFNHLLKLWVTDLLSADAGTLELVPGKAAGDGARWLTEIYHLDGITMTKDLDRHGVVPEPPKPAYYQFAPRNALPHATWSDVIETLASRETYSVLRGYGRRQHEPVEFSRDQVVWVERNPQTATQYGFGKVQAVRHWAEILLNVDISNASYFSEHEIPQGILSIAANSETEIKRHRAYFRDTIRGETDHVAPTIDAHPEEVSWTPIQGTPEELQFLDSQQWYHKLVWYLFGLNQNEIGDSGDVNQSIGEEHSRQVFRQTTKPLLDDLGEAINDEILPAMKAYWRVDGELEFFWNHDHEQMQALKRQRQTKDLKNSLTTPNEIRHERGEEEVPWGDMPLEAVTAFVRKHPEYVAEEWGGLEDVPSGGLGDLDVFGGGGNADDSSTDRAQSDDVDDAGGSGNPITGPIQAHDDDEEVGEIGDEFPGVAELIGDLSSEVGRQIQTELEDLSEDIADAWPDDPDEDRGALVDVDSIVDDVQLKDGLVDPVVESNTAAMQAAADQEADRLEDDLDEHFGLVPEVAQIDLDFDLTDTFAWEAMRRRAAKNMVSVEDTIKEQVRTTLLDVADEGGGVDDATQALRDRADGISDSHSRLIARTELPQASREGTQALGEATDVVGGKDWIPTLDANTRPWHAAMDDTDPIDVDDSWTVPSGWQGEPDHQPSDYPRTAYTVGEDQPFNCRCLSQMVLDEDMPEDVDVLDALDGVSVELHVTGRQFEVWREHAALGEDLAGLLERVADECSAREAHQRLGISTATWYDWADAFGLD